MSSRTIGIIQVILSGICFGFLGIFGKTLYDRGVVPGELLSLRFLVAALLTFAYLAIVRRSLFRQTPRVILSCAGLGVFGYALFSFCFFSALQGLSASLTVLLLYTYPALVAIGAYVFFKEKISRLHLAAFPLAAFGLLGLVWGDFSIDRAEYLGFGIAAAIFYSIYILVSSRVLKGVDAQISTPLIQIFAGVTLSLFYLRDWERTSAILQENWLLVVAIAVICSIAAMGLFLAGLQRLKGWEVSLLSTTEPLTGVLLATVFLSERLSGLQLAGALCVIASLIWVSLPTRILAFRARAGKP